jgi:glycosyltransferase 2 family protein
MLKWFARAAVSATVVWLLLTHIPFGQVLAALRQASPWVLVVTIAITGGGHYLNALKLRLLLGESRDHVTSACVRAQFAGLVANLGLPGLAGGDIVRAAYLAPIVGLRRVTVASIADRVIDTATNLIFVAIALPLAGLPGPVETILRQAGVWIAGGIAVGIAVAFGLGLLFMRSRKSALGRLWQTFLDLASRRKELAAAIGVSFLVQGAFVLTNAWVARQVGVTTAIAAWFVAWPLSKLVAVLPISLAGIGVREAALVLILSPYGAPREAVLASGILWQAFFVVMGILGFLVVQLVPYTPVAPGTPTGRKA